MQSDRLKRTKTDYYSNMVYVEEESELLAFFLFRFK